MRALAAERINRGQETVGGGDRHDSVRNKRAFWPNRSAAWNMTRYVVRICQTKRSKPHSMDRPGRGGPAPRRQWPPALGLRADPGPARVRRRPPATLRSSNTGATALYFPTMVAS